MALAATVKQRITLGGAVAVVANVTLDSSYPTGGYPLTSAIEGLSSVLAGFQSGPCGGYSLFVDEANQKLIAYYGDFNNAADGPDIEVPNTTNLSAVTGRFVFVGV